jgi:hypothetical protein
MQEAAMFVRRNELISIEERHMSRSSNLHTLLKSNEKPQANDITGYFGGYFRTTRSDKTSMPSQPEHIGHQRISRQTVEGRMT